MLGVITPFNEIQKLVKETFWKITYGESVIYPEVSIENSLLYRADFSSKIDGSFSGLYCMREL